MVVSLLHVNLCKLKSNTSIQGWTFGPHSCIKCRKHSFSSCLQVVVGISVSDLARAKRPRRLSEPSKYSRHSSTTEVQVTFQHLPITDRVFIFLHLPRPGRLNQAHLISTCLSEPSVQLRANAQRHIQPPIQLNRARRKLLNRPRDKFSELPSFYCR